MPVRRRRYPVPGIQPPKPKVGAFTETPTPSSGPQFHLFPKLPPELQLMVWNFWREEKPEVRHFIFYLIEGPCHGAFDVLSQRFITDNGSVYPMDVKIDLRVSRYPVIKLNNWDEVRGAFIGTPPPATTTSSFAWVNFEKDFFFVYDMLPSWRRGRYFSFDVRYCKWWRHIRHLTLGVHAQLKQKFHQYLPDELCSLKTISILYVPRTERCTLDWCQLLGRKTLLLKAAPYPLPLGSVGRMTSLTYMYWSPVKATAQQIESGFRKKGRRIEIKIISVIRDWVSAGW
ncbi:hypothetical protein F4805DRAFT_290994 [Annulohypoxylon moriforme]|nr:hypothetical protein F4805DRAFT_290994 [Annulohypoxylon moriforme]